MSEFRVEKGRADAVLALSNGSSVRGCFFVSDASASHAGPELIKDVLNAEPGFFPFDVIRSGQSHTALYHRDHIVHVTLANPDEPQQDPGYSVATRRDVTLLLAGGATLRGSVRVYRPIGRDRLSDYARIPERFRYVETENAALVVNFDYVIELMETSRA